MLLKKIHTALKPWYIILLLLGIWTLVSLLGIWNAYLLPPPWKVGRTFLQMLRKGEITEAILVSFRRVLLGFAVSFLLAFMAGICSAYLPGQAAYMRHISNFFRNVPPIALISLLILWFGLGELPKLIIIVLASFFPMTMNISKGFAECDKRLLEVGRSLGFSKGKQFIRICLPYAREDILVGMRIGLGYSWRALIGAEMFAAAAGLGHMIVFAQQMSRSDKVFIGIFMIGIIGCVCDKLFSVFIRKVCAGGAKTKGSAQ